MENNATNHAPAPSQSLIAMVTSLAVGMPNEEFGLLSRWMTVEANRRRDRVALDLKKGDLIQFINYSDRLTKGTVLKLGTKNALIRTENGGRMYVPLARLEKASDSVRSGPIPPLSSLPSTAPPPVLALAAVPTESVTPKAAKAKAPAKKRAKAP